MAIHATSANTSTTITANTYGDIWVVDAGVRVTTTGDAIDGTGSNGNKTFLIYGNLIAEDDGIDLGDSTNNNGGVNRVLISSTGSIFAESNAIESSGGFLELTNEGSLFSIGPTIFAEDGANVITNTGTITSSGSYGIYAADGNNTISNGGAITSSGSYGIGALGGNNVITNTGTITSSAAYGIYAFNANNTISNGGAITADSVGIYAIGGSSEVTNTGTITSSHSYGIYAGSGNNTVSNGGHVVTASDGIIAPGPGNLIANSGSVVTSSTLATEAAVNIVSLAGASSRLVNNGELASQLNAVLGGAGNETIVNRGTMDGNVDLGKGADLFKGWFGAVDGEIHGGIGFDTIGGGAGEDVIFGDNGNDVLKGGGGHDILTGGTGQDTLRGGLGDDSFNFNSVNDSAVGAQRDHIVDFAKGEDVIDVSTIDAKAGVGGNQAFTFISATAFSGTAGELRAYNSGTDSKVFVDRDGDGHADFSILVMDVSGLHAGDFVL